MFTGLIEDVGRLEELRQGADQCSLRVATGLPMQELVLGESVAVNGTCLTLTGCGGGFFTADVSPETVSVTSLSQLRRGSPVNLERALRLSDRLGGHLVTGHVDCVATIAERQRDGNAWRFNLVYDAPELNHLLVAKGSVAIDGISLTVNHAEKGQFSVAVIPHTLKMTNLQHLQKGDQVNIETDLIGKYVARMLGIGSTSEKTGISMDLLARNGFL